MGLEELVQEIRQNAADEEKRILAGAHEQAKQILKDAVEESNRVVSAAKDEAAALASEEARKISSARLKAKRVIAEGREDVVEVAIKRLSKRLGDLASAQSGEKRKKYEKLFDKLAKQAVKELGGDANILARKQDAHLAGKYGKYKGTVECTGGLVATDVHGKVRVSATFESLLEQHGPELRRLAYAELFGGKKPVSRPTQTPKEPKTKPKAKAKGGKKAKPVKKGKKR